MTVELWTKAEKFYEFWFLIIGVFLCLVVIGMIFVVSYVSKRNQIKYILNIIIIVLLIGNISFFRHNNYRFYLEQASYINPLIRDRQPRLLTYIYYNEIEQANYQKLNHLDSLQKMELYEEELIIESINYLGKGNHFHYFERENGERFKQSRQVEFINSVQSPQIVGSRFKLRDESFKDIGFKNPKNTMFDKIKIPSSEKNKRYEPEDKLQIPQAKNTIKAWNF